MEKARGFFRKKFQDPKSHQEHSRKLIAKMPCFACGGLGHWRDDPECPKRRSSGGGARHKPQDRTSRVVYWQVAHPEREGGDATQMVEALVDTACAKTVAGCSWIEEAIALFMARGF